MIFDTKINLQNTSFQQILFLVKGLVYAGYAIHKQAPHHGNSAIHKQ